jgi:phage-related tail fiber protein
MAYITQLNPNVLLGTTAEMPTALSVNRVGIFYFQTDSGQTYLTTRVAGVVTWVLQSGGGGGIIPDVGVLLRARLASIANLALAGLAAIDGVVPVAGDIIGAFGQTLGAQNGLYVAAAGAWTRASNFDEVTEVTPGTLIVVSEGTGLHGQVFELTTPAPIIVGTTVLTFLPIAGPYDSTLATGAGPIAIAVDDRVVNFNLTAGARVATLPARALVPNGHQITLVNLAPLTTTIDITPAGVETINGVAGVYTLTTSTTLVNDNTAGTWVRYGVG